MHDGQNSFNIIAASIPPSFANKFVEFYLEANQEDANLAHIKFSVKIYPEVIAGYVPDFGATDEEDTATEAAEEIEEEEEEEQVEEEEAEEEAEDTPSTGAVNGNKIGAFKGWWQNKKNAA